MPDFDRHGFQDFNHMTNGQLQAYLASNRNDRAANQAWAGRIADSQSDPMARAQAQWDNARRELDRFNSMSAAGMGVAMGASDQARQQQLQDAVNRAHAQVAATRRDDRAGTGAYSQRLPHAQHGQPAQPAGPGVAPGAGSALPPAPVPQTPEQQEASEEARARAEEYRQRTEDLLMGNADPRLQIALDVLAQQAQTGHLSPEVQNLMAGRASDANAAAAASQQQMLMEQLARSGGGIGDASFGGASRDIEAGRMGANNAARRDIAIDAATRNFQGQNQAASTLAGLRNPMVSQLAGYYANANVEDPNNQSRVGVNPNAFNVSTPSYKSGPWAAQNNMANQQPQQTQQPGLVGDAGSVASWGSTAKTQYRTPR